MKKSPLLKSEILGHFVNTFTTHDKYSRCSMQNFVQQIQTPVSQKQKNFYELFIAFLKSSSNLQHCEQKDESPSSSVSEIIDSESGGT